MNYYSNQEIILRKIKDYFYRGLTSHGHRYDYIRDYIAKETRNQFYGSIDSFLVCIIIKLIEDAGYIKNVDNGVLFKTIKPIPINLDIKLLLSKLPYELSSNTLENMNIGITNRNYFEWVDKNRKSLVDSGCTFLHWSIHKPIIK